MSDVKVTFETEKVLKDIKTGEVFEAYGVCKTLKKENFYKVWLFDLLTALGLIGNKKMLVFEYLISAMDRQNRIIKSIKEIADDLRISYKTVATTMKQLQDAGLLIKHKNSVYIVNPKVVFFGDDSRRQYLLLEYNIKE
jgi:biotin operon repressor